jgi:DNA-binding MarR family transcriptional regulator
MSAQKSKTETGSSVDFDLIIHTPARLQIVSILYVIESADFTFLTHQTGFTRGNLSSHLTKLEDAGYVDIEKKFIKKIPRTIVSLSKSGRKAFKKYKQDMKNLLDISD